MADQQEQILKILESEQLEPSENVQAMCEKIMARHPERVQALIYYGSSLRAMNDPAKMLDFYVIVDSYRKTHKNPLRILLNAWFPPAVYYLENDNTDGSISTCKYSIISLKAFENRCQGFFTIVWGRFAQPCVLLMTKNEKVKTRIQTARANALKHLAKQTAPLLEPDIDFTTFWARGFMESYNTELRPENSGDRSKEIVSRYAERYEALKQVLDGEREQAIARKRRFYCKWKWAWRQILGKPYAALRVLNSAFTFDGGLDYVLHKLKNHSGKTIDVSESQKRHPILWSPVLAWKLYRVGAFR